MSVVNVKVAYLRPRYQNLEEWCQQPNHVYIGRRGIVFIDSGSGKCRYPSTDSFWANPFKIGRDGDRDTVLQKYRNYILSSSIHRERLPELKGKVLGCWCHPEPCHGDILLELCN